MIKFREIAQDIFDVPTDIIFITTNGTIKSDGSGVMGAGVALEAELRYPELPDILGKVVRDGGNIPHRMLTTLDNEIWSFPVKHNWFEKADIFLIEESCKRVACLLEKGYTCVLPRPGCGNGKLSWDLVKPLIEKHLNYKNLIIVYK